MAGRRAHKSAHVLLPAPATRPLVAALPCGNAVAMLPRGSGGRGLRRGRGSEASQGEASLLTVEDGWITDHGDNGAAWDGVCLADVNPGADGGAQLRLQASRAAHEVQRAQGQATAARKEAARARSSEAAMGAELSVVLAMALQQQQSVPSQPAWPPEEGLTGHSPWTCSSDGGSTTSSLWSDAGTSSPYSVGFVGSDTTADYDSAQRASATPPPLPLQVPPPLSVALPTTVGVPASTAIACAAGDERCPYCWVDANGGEGESAEGDDVGKQQMLGRTFSWHKKRRRDAPPVSA